MTQVNGPTTSKGDRRRATTAWITRALWAAGLLCLVAVTVTIIWPEWAGRDVTPFGMLGLAFTVYGVVLAFGIFVLQRQEGAAQRAEDLSFFTRFDSNVESIKETLERAQETKTGARVTAAQSGAADGVIRRLQRERPAIVLWVDDNPAWVEDERAIFDEAGNRSILVTDTQQALSLLDSDNRFDLVVTDMKRGDSERAGYELLRGIRSRSLSLPVIVYSTSDDPEHARQWRKAGGQRSAWEPIGLFEALADILTK